MVIPGCHSGKLYRGGKGGICEQKDDDGSCLNMRGCDDNSLFLKYPSMDVIMSDE